MTKFNEYGIIEIHSRNNYRLIKQQRHKYTEKEDTKNARRHNTEKKQTLENNNDDRLTFNNPYPDLHRRLCSRPRNLHARNRRRPQSLCKNAGTYLNVLSHNHRSKRPDRLLHRIKPKNSTIKTEKSKKEKTTAQAPQPPAPVVYFRKPYKPLKNNKANNSPKKQKIPPPPNNNKKPLEKSSAV